MFWPSSDCNTNYSEFGKPENNERLVDGTNVSEEAHNMQLFIYRKEVKYIFILAVYCSVVRDQSLRKTILNVYTLQHVYYKKFVVIRHP